MARTTEQILAAELANSSLKCAGLQSAGERLAEENGFLKAELKRLQDELKQLKAPEDKTEEVANA